MPGAALLPSLPLEYWGGTPREGRKEEVGVKERKKKEKIRRKEGGKRGLEGERALGTSGGKRPQTCQVLLSPLGL